jgi:transcriptional regulator with XRE-family HTH domain
MVNNYTLPMPRVSRLKLPPLHMDNDEIIGHRIARLRKDRGFTQTELADKIGIMHHLVSDYEKGKIRLYDEMVARFAIAMNVSTDEILGLRNGQKVGAKPSLKIIRRMKALEGLPQSKQRTILDSLDLMIQSAKNNGRDS